MKVSKITNFNTIPVGSLTQGDTFVFSVEIANETLGVYMVLGKKFSPLGSSDILIVRLNSGELSHLAPQQYVVKVNSELKITI